LAGPESGDVEVRSFETEVFGAFLYVGFGVEGLLLGDQNLLRLWRDRRRLLGRLRYVRHRICNVE
jgi:hypothetical protein